jgi:hypothetical protein
MENNEYELYKKLAALEMENGNLKTQMEKLSKDVDTNQVTEVYEAAKANVYSDCGTVGGIYAVWSCVY